MLTDPFSLKSRSKLSPSRIAFTARARWCEYLAQRKFEAYELPRKEIEDLPDITTAVSWDDTSVTKLQLQHLLKGLEDTELIEGCVVELGSYRGETTIALSRHTARLVVAVDPFLGGWGATNEDFRTFINKIQDSPKIVHVHKTSGEGASSWEYGPASFVFIDAVHNYVNVAFDISVWWPKLAVGGIMAFHDTDLRIFSGTRRAVHELVEEGTSIYAHPNNLTMLRKLK
ncbi:class I SAM-dependent methyltransferase [Bythopirellula polymerisocia]|uniref:Class I SAM-dependent methyltransferase n=1 Tax=Bythopirellula polymerisocia TaxID=2528003 RepID=A0A5C6CNX0_9BACT|nr:class I SAM-dependent methyltransferase [Bythopirellula polymerisocia]TWU25795.1 hypothetical protein Pla144_30070 [Bythopirellula polymerisocia]